MTINKSIRTIVSLFSVGSALIGSSLSAGTVTDTYLDTFSSDFYNNNYGSQDFSAGWIESGEATDPAAGSMQIDLDQLRFTTMDATKKISRDVDLSGAISVILDLDFTGDTGNVSINVQVWNGVGWDTLATISNGSGSIMEPLDTAQISSNSAIQFVWASGNWNNKTIFVDNVKFTATYLDTDDDGVADKFDVDDDNDGILDKLEGLVADNNPGFEEPLMGTNTWTLVNDSQVPFWNTTASDGKMEFWADGFLGTPAYSGNQFVELNANQSASLYQEITTIPGEVIEFSIAHRGRSGTDVATMSVGAPGALTVVKTMSTDNTAWVVYKTIYTVPSGQTTTRISFDAVSSSNGSPSYGNLLDAFELFKSNTDSDGDEIPNRLDLDSDNDGIPDNVEAQGSDAFTLSETPPIVRTDGSNENYLQTGLQLIDTDGDGIYDNIDSDSDNDLITDCVEGLSDTRLIDNGTTRNCAVTIAMVGTNGLADWAESSDDYTTVGGLVSNPDPDAPSTDLDDEISINNEAAYREAACGPAEVNLTSMQWKTVSFPCDLGTNDLQDILGGPNGLDTYGDNDNWVMYEQVDPDYSGDRDGMHLMVNGTDHVVAGKGYWIIADQTKTVHINRPLVGITQTATTEANNYPGLPNSYRVMPYSLPTSDNFDYKKVMIGNPFFKTFKLSNMYYQNATKNVNYVSMAALITGDPMEPTVYIKDSNDTTTGNYIAIVPATPGFTDVVPTMQGFWIKLNAGNIDTNKITYPLEK